VKYDLPDVVGVCPLAQGWDKDIALGDHFNFRLFCGWATHTTPIKQHNRWYFDSIAKLFMAELDRWHGVDSDQWIILEAVVNDSINTLELYCTSLDWLMMYILNGEDESHTLTSLIVRIEERIRAS
jgi:hypothetical protein